MTRKTAYEHNVSGHTRQGRPVRKYKRGQGKASKNKPSKSRMPSIIRGFVVTLFYSRGKEVLNISSGTVPGAVKEAMSKRKRGEVPYHAQLRRSSK